MFIGTADLPVSVDEQATDESSLIDPAEIVDVAEVTVSSPNIKEALFTLVCRTISAAFLIILIICIFLFLSGKEVPCFLENFLTSSFTSLLSILTTLMTAKDD
jgi:predicted PurR-regulated permease PerM